MSNSHTSKPPADDLPEHVTSIDPTGGPQGPYFSEDLDRYPEVITWSDIRSLNPTIWIDDERRIDFIDMFGSLDVTINKQQLLKYIARLKTDCDMASKHGSTSYRATSKSLNIKKHNKPYTHYTFDDMFTIDEYNDIVREFNECSFKSEESTEVRQVYTIRRDDYMTNNTLTALINRVLNYNTWCTYKECIESSTNKNIHECLHLFRLVKDLPGYINKAHMDKNNLLTMMIFIDCESGLQLGTELLDYKREFVKRVPYKSNAGYMFTESINESTYHSYTNKIKSQRLSIMYNIYENEEQYLSIYDTKTRWGILNRARHIKEIRNNMFKTQELATGKIDWNNPRVISHRKSLPVKQRFNKNQGCINYNSLSHKQLNELLIDKNLCTTGDYLTKIHRLKASRAADTEIIESMWDPSHPKKYFTVQG